MKKLKEEVNEEAIKAKGKAKVGKLGPLEKFSYEGKIYTRRKITPDGVKALSIAGDKLITLPPDTEVTKEK